jgi:hypothetical protein
MRRENSAKVRPKNEPFERKNMIRAAVAGIAYFGTVFVAGFVLGMLRVLVLVPQIGESVAVGLELPVMLAISWIACRWLIFMLEIPPAFGERAVMGAIAFAVLMLAEFGLSMLALGRTVFDHLAHYREVPGALGLAGQIAFAAFPVIQQVLSRRER